MNAVIDSFLGSLTHIVNGFLQSGTTRTGFKHHGNGNMRKLIATKILDLTKVSIVNYRRFKFN